MVHASTTSGGVRLCGSLWVHDSVWASPTRLGCLVCISFLCKAIRCSCQALVTTCCLSSAFSLGLSCLCCGLDLARFDIVSLVVFHAWCSLVLVLIPSLLLFRPGGTSTRTTGRRHLPEARTVVGGSRCISMIPFVCCVVLPFFVCAWVVRCTISCCQQRGPAVLVPPKEAYRACSMSGSTRSACLALPR